MKHSYFSPRRVLATLSVLFCSLLGTNAPLLAQTFNTPIAYEDSWPMAGSPDISLTSHTSAYSFGGVSITGLGAVDLALAGWDDPFGIVAGASWRYLQPGNPSIVLAQGVIPYTNVRDVEVGFLDVSGSSQMLVAYYELGVGHKIDVYDLTTSGPSLLYTNVLSTSPIYGRISMDCHLTYAVSLVWEEGGVIYTMVGLNSGPSIAFSGVLTLAKTGNDFMPDCAFSHTSMGGSLNVHYCYYSPATGIMREVSYDFWAMIYMSTGTVVPTLFNDFNFIGFYSDPVIANIDCPGHYDVENWAYAYTTNNQDISVRLVDYHTMASAATRIINDGSVLACTAINGNYNYAPFPAYDPNHSPGAENIYVGWYTNTPDPAAGMQPAGYVAVRMTENGLVALSPLDYLGVANNPTWATQTPVLSFSKQDDIFPFLYTVFPEYNPGFPGYQLQNKYHNWSSPMFKGEEAHNAFECNDEARIAEFKSKMVASTTIKAYPNPFTNVLGLSFPASMQQSSTTIVVSDMTGKVMDTYSGQVSKVNAHLTDLSKTLSPGAYIMNVSVEGQTKQTIKVTKVQ